MSDAKANPARHRRRRPSRPTRRRTAARSRGRQGDRHDRATRRSSPIWPRAASTCAAPISTTRPPSTAAFAGADRLLLISTDALHAPGLRLRQHRNAVTAAEQAGVGTSSTPRRLRPIRRPQSSLIDDHFWTEAALFASAMDWTILRDNIYSEMILLSLPHAVATGQLFTATGTGGRSYVTREDCARTAAAALASATGRQILDVTGPSAVTQTNSRRSPAN